MADYISREAALEAHCMNCQYIDQEDDKSTCWCMGKDRFNRIPTADVVARDCYDRTLAENDMMREQLAQIGKKPGDTMDDVRPVMLCRDCVYYNTTGCADGFGWCEGVMVSKETSDDFFCAEGKQNPYECGAEMERNLDTTKGGNHD